MKQSSDDQRSRARFRYMVAACATAGLVGGTFFAVASASSEQEPTPPGPARGQEWATNARGESYGSMADARTPAEEPDLILAISDAGEQGYVKKEALDGPIPRTPEEAAQLSSEPRVIPVYESDGTTQIGWFTIGENFVESGD